MLHSPSVADRLSTPPPSTMSAECEAVTPHSLQGKPIGASASLGSSGPQGHPGTQGISYEGRVSVIPPLAGYEAAMRASVELDRVHHSSSQSHYRMQNSFYNSSIDCTFRQMYERSMYPHINSYHIPENCQTTYTQRNDVFSVPNSSSESLLASSLSENVCPYMQNTGIITPTNTLSISSIVKQEQMELSSSQNEINDKESKLYQSPPSFDAHLSSFSQETRLAATDNDQNLSNKSDNPPQLTKNSPKDHQSFTVQDKIQESPNYKCNITKTESIINENAPDTSVGSRNSDSSQDSISTPFEGELDHLAKLQSAIEKASYLDQEENSKDGETYHCHLCPFSAQSKVILNNHFNMHYDLKCSSCDFTATCDSQLKDHRREEHCTSPEIDDVDDAKMPRVNSQGKVKTFKCKQCGFTTVTKGEFWEHARAHIKSEKLLTCPKCPFVTEYKHHLEYHLRNHFGSKPYKCNKCTYSCVNKSMLNSHMKSHSNIYQYRCADCSYATKYCHSLKLHLRKYSHNPAMVLNPDGSPNPVPIIDVYGTRRGPKLKKDENGMPILPPHYHIQAQILRAQMEVTGQIPKASSAPSELKNLCPPRSPGANSVSIPQSQNFSYSYSGIQEYTSGKIFTKILDQDQKTEEKEASSETSQNWHEDFVSENTRHKCNVCTFITTNGDIFSQHMLIHAATAKESYNNEESRRQSPSPVQINVSENNSSFPNLYPPVTSMLPLTELNHHSYSTLAVAQNLKEYLARAINPFLYQQMFNGQALLHPALGLHLQRLTNTEENQQASQEPLEQKEEEPESALDLSKEQTPPQQQQKLSQSSASPSPYHSSPPSSSPPRSETSTPPSKNRRKGRAYKLERIALRLSEHADGGEAAAPETQQNQETSLKVPELVPIQEDSIKPQDWGGAHPCHYCDMAFKDVVMYTMHMGYHGYKNPFTCNMCGFEANDKVAFFLHIARSSHS